MKTLNSLLVALIGFVPAAALAHGEGGHPADPNLNVNPALEDCSVQFSAALTQDAFGRFVREFGSTSAFRTLAPPTPLGRGRVELGVQYISFTVDEKDPAWNETFHHPDAYHELGSDLSFPKFRLRVGVTDRVDLAAFWTRNPKANYGWAGFAVQYGLLQQTETMPISLALRGAYTKTLYVEDMDMHALSTEIVAGRTYRNLLTPYVGVGSDLVLARETSDVVSLDTEWQDASRAFAGLSLRVWHVALGAEAEVGALNRTEFLVTALF